MWRRDGESHLQRVARFFTTWLPRLLICSGIALAIVNLGGLIADTASWTRADGRVRAFFRKLAETQP